MEGKTSCDNKTTGAVGTRRRGKHEHLFKGREYFYRVLILISILLF